MISYTRYSNVHHEKRQPNISVSNKNKDVDPTKANTPFVAMITPVTKRKDLNTITRVGNECWYFTDNFYI